ncbi:MAG: ORF6N domain-containing protein [Chitinophagaceae bacterium]|nr:ORF6N domain-containing protein [Chitinophagaceae bacterium]
MSTELLLADAVIENKIYTIRGEKVMLDRDLAALYGVETRVLNQAVKRNEKRFPPDFMFQLTKTELEDWKSQFVISNSGKVMMGLRKLPYVFTEHGVAMLSGVLKSEKAIEVNIQIIRIFNRLRETVLQNKDILLKLEQLDKKMLNLHFDIRMHDGEIETIFELIREIIAEKQASPAPKNPIGFKSAKK